MDDGFNDNFILPLCQGLPLSALPPNLRKEVLTAAAFDVFGRSSGVKKITDEPPALSEECGFFHLTKNGKLLFALAVAADEEGIKALGRELQPSVKNYHRVSAPLVLSRGRAKLSVEELRGLVSGDFVFYEPSSPRAVFGQKRFAAALDRGMLSVNEPLPSTPSRFLTLEVETARTDIVATQLVADAVFAVGEEQSAALSLRAERVATGELRKLENRSVFYVTEVIKPGGKVPPRPATAPAV